MTTEVSTKVNNLLTAEEALWQDARTYWQVSKRSFTSLVTTLALLRQHYPGDAEFGKACAIHIPDMDAKSRYKLVQIGANIIARGNDVPAAEIFSLSLDALTEYSKAPIEQQHQIEADVKAGKKVTAKKIKEATGVEITPKSSDRVKELEAQLATMNERYTEAKHNFEATMDELEELRAEVEASPTSGAAFDKLKEELRQAKAEAAKAKAEANQPQPESFEYCGMSYERALKAIKWLVQKSHPDQAGASQVPSDAYTLVQYYKENFEEVYARYKSSKQK